MLVRVGLRRHQRHAPDLLVRSECRRSTTPNLSLTQNRANINERRPVTDFQTINRWMHGLNSSYHALQVSMDKRYSREFTVSASYTWSKNLDYVSRAGFGGSFGINNPFDFFFSRGASDMARDHRFVGSFVCGPAAVEELAESSTPSWAIGGSAGSSRCRSGRPFSIGASNNPIAGAGSARADLVGAGYPILDTGRSKGEKIARLLRQDTLRQSRPEHVWHAGTEHPARPRFRQCRSVAGQGLAASVHRRVGPDRIPVRGIQRPECHAPGQSGHRHDQPQLREDHRHGRQSAHPADGSQGGLVAGG